MRKEEIAEGPSFSVKSKEIFLKRKIAARYSLTSELTRRLIGAKDIARI